MEQVLDEGRPALLEIDLQGARQVREAMPEARFVFLEPPSWEELVHRLVGRGTEADLRINDPGVSRRHIEFVVTGDATGLAIQVNDLGSTNGMLVDGHRITSTGVRDGTQVKIGNTTMTVRLVEEE